MENLYELIENLNKQYQQSYNKVMIYKGCTYQYTLALMQCEHAERNINTVEKIYSIDYRKLAKIITKAKGEEYRFKVFRELGLDNGNEYYTYDYMACYVNKDNKYFDTNEDTGICLGKEEYKEMLDGLTEKNSMIVSRGGVTKFVPTNPCLYLNKINYIQLLTRGQTNETQLLMPEFKEQIKSMLKERLEQVEVGEFEQNMFGL